MFLFSKDKEFILKITNAILLIWFLAALVFSFNNTLDLLIDKPNNNNKGCTKENCAVKDGNCGCQNIEYFDMETRYQKISFYTSMANVVIVGGALYFLNKEKETKKKK